MHRNHAHSLLFLPMKSLFVILKIFHFQDIYMHRNHSLSFPVMISLLVILKIFHLEHLHAPKPCAFSAIPSNEIIVCYFKAFFIFRTFTCTETQLKNRECLIIGMTSNYEQKMKFSKKSKKIKCNITGQLDL